MWRFMIVTFAFLGWSFYVMSGGSAYAPSENSLQARAGSSDAQAPTVEVVRLDDQSEADDNSIVTRSAASLADLDLTDGKRFQVTLAAADADEVSLPKTERVQSMTATIEAAVAEANAGIVAAEEVAGAVVETAPKAQPESVQTGFVGEQVFSLETYVMRQNSDYTPTTEASLQGADDGGLQAYGDGDFRRVTGNSVNMRSGPGTDYQRVGSLAKGTQIMVLEEPGNGWVMLEVVSTGETGWMADWLITASN